MRLLDDDHEVANQDRILQFDYTSVELETKSILMKLLEYYNRITLSFL